VQGKWHVVIPCSYQAMRREYLTASLECPRSCCWFPCSAVPYAWAVTRTIRSRMTDLETLSTWTGPPKQGISMTTRKRHIISLLLQNEVGALTRVASLFSTRGYNIESLNVAPTDDPTVSRLTLVTTGTDEVIQQILNQSLKLIDVVNVDDVTRDQHVERELLLIKLRTSHARLTALQTSVQRAGARVLSEEPDSFTVELTASESEINRFIADLANYGDVLEVVRSGALAILRGATTLSA
jgi:acetolactate synthase I/III small subunit